MKRYLVRTAIMHSEIISAENIQELDQHMRAMQKASAQKFLLLSIEQLDAEELGVPDPQPSVA